MESSLKRWLHNSIADAKAAWFAERAMGSEPEPTEGEQKAFTLGFTWGGDAALDRIAELLEKDV